MIDHFFLVLFPDNFRSGFRVPRRGDGFLNASPNAFAFFQEEPPYSGHRLWVEPSTHLHSLRCRTIP